MFAAAYSEFGLTVEDVMNLIATLVWRNECYGPGLRRGGSREPAICCVGFSKVSNKSTCTAWIHYFDESVWS